MTQRNFQNERYKTEVKGQTRKSAAGLKPKTKAASSVYIKPQTKTRKEKKQIKEAERVKRAELNRLYYSPPTEEYKRFRRIWWVLLAAAIIATAASMVLTFTIWEDQPEKVMFVLGPAYVLIILSLVLDFTKGRKMRLAYQQEMMKKQHKATRRAIEAEAQKEVNAVQKSEQMLEGEGPVSRLAIRIGRFMTFKRKDVSEEDKKSEEKPSDAKKK